MRRSGRELESGWDPSKIDAKVASFLVPEAHSRDADDMPMIWCSGAQPMKKSGGWVVLLIWYPGAINSYRRLKYSPLPLEFNLR